MKAEKGSPYKVPGQIDTELSCLLVATQNDYNGVNTEPNNVYLVSKIDNDEWILTKLTSHKGYHKINVKVAKDELVDGYLALPEGYKIILTQ